ncbi:hypothetical protein ACHWQZ_G010976 [Mnemiopsis leidyi]
MTLRNEYGNKTLYGIARDAELYTWIGFRKFLQSKIQIFPWKPSYIDISINHDTGSARARGKKETSM